MQSDRRSFLQITGGALIGAALPFAAQAKFDISPERAREVRFLGSEDAAVTVSEYFSMTCGHCGNFHRNTFPEIKEKLINTGIIQFEMHPFPLDQLALQAHALCRVLPNASYFKMVDVLLDQQQIWVRSEDPVAKLKQYAKFAGISSQDYDNIMSNRTYLESIVEIRQTAVVKHKVQSTPSFVINGEKTFGGAVSYEEFLAELNAFGI